MTKILKKICQFSFGTFEEEEFRRFVHVGFIFFLLIGIYWTLRPLKDSIFIQLVGKSYIPYAKTISLILMLPILAIYTKLLKKFTKEKAFHVLVYFYILLVMLFAFPVYLSQSGVVTNNAVLNIIGYLWYFSVESFGSIMIAFFWGLLTDSIDSRSAKRGFALVYLFGQIGGSILPLTITKAPIFLSMKTDVMSLIVVACLIYLIIPISKDFFTKNSQQLNVASVDDKNNSKETPINKKAKFIDGLKLLCSHRYLIGLFLMEFFFEFVITIVDFNFKMLAGTVYSGVNLTAYLGNMAATVNTTTALILIFLSNRIQRLFGIKIAILFIPVIVGSIFLYFINTKSSLQVMFMLVIVGKAVNYAFRSSFKQLYIPTTPDVHFRIQAWTDVFGARGAKQIGSIFNMLFIIIGKAKYLMLGRAIGFPLVITWIATTFYLGKTCEKAVSEKKIII
jgi:AAA family ATP:ADP antiporter